MGRAMRWFKKLLTGRKERHKGLKENHVAGDWHDGTDREKGRWSFVKQRKSGVDGGRRPSEAAAAEPSQVTPCHCGGEGARTREERAAVVIQKAFRGYLARKALRALRGLVQLQALVRGYLVRKQAATTLHRLQALMRLQADSYAVKTASHRNSMEQERIVTQVARMKPLATPGHRRRLSDSTDSNYERSPRIVEVDTCHLRSRSTRIVSSRYTPDHSSDRRLTPALASSCSPLSRKQPPRLSIRRCHERDPRRAKTAQNTPRCFGPAPTYDSPAKSVDGLTSRRLSHRDVLVSPSYMADTASFAARMRCQSASNQRQAEAPRASLTRAGTRKSCSQTQDSAFSTQTGCSGLSDEAARDYYLDRMW